MKESRYFKVIKLVTKFQINDKQYEPLAKFLVTLLSYFILKQINLALYK